MSSSSPLSSSPEKSEREESGLEVELSKKLEEALVDVHRGQLKEPAVLLRGMRWSAYQQWKAKKDTRGLSFRPAGAGTGGVDPIGDVEFWLDPTSVHEAVIREFEACMTLCMARLGVRELVELRGSAEYRLPSGRCKEPDASYVPTRSCAPGTPPSMVLEVAWSQTKISLKRDLLEWVENGSTKVAIGIVVRQQGTAGPRMCAFVARAGETTEQHLQRIPFSREDGCTRAGLPRFTLKIPVPALLGGAAPGPCTAWGIVGALLAGDMRGATRALWAALWGWPNVEVDLWELLVRAERAMPVPSE